MDVFFIIILVLASIVGLTFIVERGLALRWQKIIPPEVESIITNFRGAGDAEKLRNACKQHPSPLSNLLLFADEHRMWSKVENAEALQTKARHEIVRMERGLVILEIVVGIAPLLGLVGTIYGLIILFGGMSQADFGNNAAVANGIALALRATLLGLLTAIPSLIAWSYFTKKVETMAVEMESLCERFLRQIYHEPRGQTDEARLAHVMV